MIKLDWVEDFEERCTFSDSDYPDWEEQRVMKTGYKDYIITVYQVRDKFGGYEYEILYPEEHEAERYDSFFDSYNGGDTHAKSYQQAMEWAENTLEGILEEEEEE